MPKDPGAVWYSTVDGGEWEAQVLDLPGHDGYRGTLTVTRVRDGKVVLNEEVGISFRAQFGPDMGDVAEWQDKCLTAIDAANDEERGT